MIETFARIYVNIVEPGAQILAVVLAVLFLLYIFNVLRGGAAKGDALSLFVGGMIKLIGKTLQILWSGFFAMLRSLSRGMRILFATVRDFLFSRDL